MFLIFFCLAAGVYVFGTVGYKFKVQDARGGDLVRPFLPICWKGTAHSGVSSCRTRSSGGRSGGW